MVAALDPFQRDEILARAGEERLALRDRHVLVVGAVKDQGRRRERRLEDRVVIADRIADEVIAEAQIHPLVLDPERAFLLPTRRALGPLPSEEPRNEPERGREE